MGDIKCRVCLATSDVKMYHPLHTSFPEFMNSDLSVLNILETVTSTNVFINPELPNQICTACLKSLRDCWNFVREFKDSQILLQVQLSKDFIKDDEIIVKVEPANDDFNYDYSALQVEINEITENQNGCKKEEKSVKPVKNKSTKKKSKIKEIKNKKENNENVILMSVEDVLREENERKANKIELKESPDDSNSNSAAQDEDFTEQILICTEEDMNGEDILIKLEEGSQEDYPEIIETIDKETGLRIMSIGDSASSKKKKTNKNNKLLMPASDKIKNMVVKKKGGRKKVQDLNCKDCHKTYPTARKLSYHRFQLHNPRWKEKFVCEICGYQNKTVSGYTHHKRKHKGKQFSCDLCDKIYLTTTQLKDHKRRVHDKIFKEYLCNYCGKVFKFTTALKYHLSSVHKIQERQFVCRFCGGRYHTISSLSRHERCHTGERPYKCKFCDKAFKGTPELRTHELRHVGKTIYNCPYCDKGFYQTWNMKIHMLQHQGSFKCTICKRSFIDAAVLNFHMARRHKGEFEYKEAVSSEDETYGGYVSIYEDEEVIISDSLLED